MTSTVGKPPTHNAPAVLARGFLTGSVIGASLTAFISGCVVESAQLAILGLLLPAVYGLLFFLFTLPRRAREAAVVPRTALAVVESLKAVGGETSDVPVRFELSVAPDDAPAFRVEVRQDINLVELPDYRVGGIVVVEYPPDRPWKTRIVKRPTPEWEERAATTRVDSAPGPAMKSDSPAGCADGLLTLFGLLLGVAAVLLLFRADLFDVDAEEGESGPFRRPAISASSSTTVVTSATGTVNLGPGQSMLDEGELRRAIESLTRGANTRRALTVVVQDRSLTVVFAPAGVETAGFDPRSLPYDRVPGLVQKAGAGVGSPRGWQLAVDGVTGSLTLRVVVTGDGGTGVLEADGQGRVLRRSGG
ncbi:hypothetical protein [Micromonospora carbonacea]|uniref:DUF3592 domain-containing protein n=1 Tax=Micromonospora carbonacea TaxID=47853 RepID=A0A7H8XNW1_9ACTN|nr:hypothetical protein [Micromonospora carbonacea]MBB5825387.1 hypothetical protein [Micromonospora carbonacea]QLD26555.1 hypothetical protein HXZ27_21990 [Micromonospora carbonacea]